MNLLTKGLSRQLMYNLLRGMSLKTLKIKDYNDDNPIQLTKALKIQVYRKN